MSALPGFGISPAPSNTVAITERRLGDLLDILFAIRMDVGHNANGIAASPSLGPEQMREVRVLLDCAIVRAKEIFSSMHLSATLGFMLPDPDSRGRRATPMRMARVGQTLF